MSFKPHALVLADFYKTGHPSMMPEGLTKLYSNFTPRSNRLAPTAVCTDSSSKIDRVVFWKLQALIKEWLIDYFNNEFFGKSKEEIVEEYCRINDGALGKGVVLPDHIAALHDLGYLPLRIKALPEGSLVDMKVPVFTVVNTHKDFGWLAGRFEDLFSCELWKGITAATVAFEFRKLLEKYAELTGSPKDFVMWQGHDFSLRGMGGMMDGAANQSGHLLSFFGTDTIPSILYLEKYYGAKGTFVGGSVPASEHSVASANILRIQRDLETKGEWDGEKLADQPEHLSLLAKAERLFLKNYITKVVPTGIASYVSDTYDFFSVITQVAPTLKDEILNRQPNALGLAKVVFRPDCYDEETEILTRSGWKYFRDLTLEDEVGQVTQDERLEFVTPSRVINQEYTGEMIEFKDHFGKVDLLVTPNHRMVFKFPKSSGLKVQEAAKATFYNKKTAVRSASLPCLGQELTPLERLCVAFQADGSYPSHIPEKEGSVSGYRTIRFNFSKNRKVDRLESILRDGGWKYSKEQYPSRDGQWTFYVWLPLEVEMTKDLSWVNLSAITCGDWCRDFTEEVSHWDACRRHDDRFKFDTTVESVAKVVRDVAILGGYGALLSTYTDERKEHFSDVFTVHIMRNNEVDTQAFSKRVVNYSGRVYCVSVPSGMVLVKRNKCTMVSGNSGDPTKVLCGYKIADLDQTGQTLEANGYDLYDDGIEVVKTGDRYYHFKYDTDLYDYVFVEAKLGGELPAAEAKGAVECLWDIFGGTETAKGFKVLHERVGLIYGDSITLGRGEEILRRLAEKGFASCNVVFGVGSYTYQYHTRDTFGFAMKATWCEVDGEGLDIFKDPATDSGTKKSAKGLLRVEKEDGRFVLYDQQTPEQEAQGELKVVFEDGKLVKETTLEEVRATLASYL